MRAVIKRAIVVKLQFGHIPKSQATCHFSFNKAMTALEPLGDALYIGGSIRRHIIDFGDFQISRHADVSDGDHFKARVPYAPLKQFSHCFFDLLANSFGTCEWFHALVFQFRLGFFNVKAFNCIADFKVIVVFNADAAFIAVLNLLGVILEALQGRDATFINNHVIS